MTHSFPPRSPSDLDLGFAGEWPVLRQRRRRLDGGLLISRVGSLFLRRGRFRKGRMDRFDRRLAGERDRRRPRAGNASIGQSRRWRSEEHTSELQSLMRISYAVFCLKKKKKQ